MADLRIVDAPVLLQESITDDVKMPTGGLGNFSVRLGDILWYVITKEQLANKNYVDLSSKGVKDSLDEHIADKNNPHNVTKAQVGLGNVDNTADIDKPVSNATKSAIITATTDMATKAYVNQKDNLKADKATTLSGYGITDAYTKGETLSQIEIDGALTLKADVAYVDGKDGDLTTLKTTDKTNLVKAVNEIHDVTKGVVALYDRNVEVGAGTNGWDANLVAYGETTQKQINDGIESISQLASINNPHNGQRVYVKGYHKPTLFVELNPYKGSGLFVYDAAVSRSKHDGGTIIDPTKVFPTDWKNRTQVNDWFIPSNTGTGCWVRQYDGAVDVLWFGARPDFSLGVDNSIAINKALSVKNNISLPSGNYIIHHPILTAEANVIIRGDGVDNTLITVENQYWQGTTYNNKAYNAAIAITSGQDNIWIEAATIENLSMLGNSYSADGKIGIDFDNVCMRVNVKNVVISAFDKGIHTFKSWAHNYNGVSVTDCVTNSMHLDSFANGFSLNGCVLYGKSIMTACHLLIENGSYGNSFTGGVIEKANVGVTLRNNAQINISGVDWEVFDLLWLQQIDCSDLPSKIDNCALMGNPYQNGIVLNNGNLVVDTCKIFNPDGAITSDIFFAGGTGKLVLNDNKYGQHTGKLFNGDAKIIGNDVGRVDFKESVRSNDVNVLDKYSENNDLNFSFVSSSGDAYKTSNLLFKRTQIGNIIKSFTRLNVNQTQTTGDNFILAIPELNGFVGLVGQFAFSPTNDNLFRDGVFGSVVSNGSGCYLVKNSGGLLAKNVLVASYDNLFNINLNYADSI